MCRSPAILDFPDCRVTLPACFGGWITDAARVLVGEQGQATPPAMARAIAQAIPGATPTILPEARHITPVECPARWNARPGGMSGPVECPAPIAAAIAGLLAG